MDFRQLEAFIKVIELKSFTRAADAMFVSQPSVSAYINFLEKELDTVLINRTTKELSPTKAGEIFFEKAKDMLAIKSSTFEKIKHLSDDLSGEIVITASTVPSQYILPRAIKEFREMYPNISFRVKQGATVTVCEEVGLQKSEIGIAGGIVRNDKCVFKEFMSESLVFIAPVTTSLSQSATHDLAELLYNYPYISREQGSGTRIQYEDFFESAGVELGKINIAASFDNTQSIINAVKNGLGYSMVSQYAAADYTTKEMVVPINLTISPPPRKFYYVLKKSLVHSHLVTLFTDYLDTFEQGNM